MGSWANAHTFIVLLHHDWNQTALSSRVHLSPIHRHCISLFTLQDEEKQQQKSAGQIQSCDFLSYVWIWVCFLFFFVHTMIIFMHSSVEGADWHSMVVTSPSMLLMLHSSHFPVSVGPTAHHLMGLDVVTRDCSRKQGNQSRWWSMKSAKSIRFRGNVCIKTD